MNQQNTVAILKKIVVAGAALFACQLMSGATTNRLCGWPFVVFIIVVWAFPSLISAIADADYRRNLNQRLKQAAVMDDDDTGFVAVLWLLPLIALMILFQLYVIRILDSGLY